jgi:hypothetical protein
MDAENIYRSFENIEFMKSNQFETLKTSLQNCDIYSFEKSIENNKYYEISPTFLTKLFIENVFIDDFEKTEEFEDEEERKECEEYFQREKITIGRVLELTKIILEKNPNIDYIKFKGKYESALDRAIYCKKVELVNFLLSYKITKIEH